MGGQCTQERGNCYSSQTCCSQSQTCYLKHEHVAVCRPTGNCVAGVHLDDKPEHQTPWACTVWPSLDVTAHSAPCGNSPGSDEECDGWAESGDCAVYPAFMLRY